MPIRIRWILSEYFGIGLILLGLSGFFQLFFIFIGQYVLQISNYFVVILVPIGVTIAMFYANMIIFESYTQVKRDRMLRTQFKKARDIRSMLRKILDFPITKPLLITSLIFIAVFFSIYYICTSFLNHALSFLTAENFGAVICLLIANLIEKNYAKIQKY
jgi:hypothetical protein